MTVISTFVEMKKRFADSLEHVTASAGKLRPKGQTVQFAAELTAIRNELAAIILSVFKNLPGLVSSDQFLTAPGRQEWEGVTRFVDGLPENLVMHELYDAGAEIHARTRTAEVNFRGLVNDVLLIRLPDRLRKSAEALRSAVRRVWTETEQVQHIVQYNLDTAIDELTAERAETAAPSPDADGESGEERRPTPQEIIDQAWQLSSDGLTRASGILDRLATSLRKPWEEFVGAIDRELQEDWVAIHRRLKAADSADEQWAGFRARMTRQIEKLLGRIGSDAASARERIRRALRTGRRRAESLIRIGQSAVGVADGGELSRYETIDALSSVDDLRNSLPLIYRRLFSFEPLDEPSLLEGRARDLVWIKQHFGRWRTSMQPGVVLVQASLGSGRTSFLYALRHAIFSDFDVRWVNLPERLYHPDDFARVIANVLGLQSPEITIGELEEYLESLKRSDPPQVLLIDNLEHLLMRAPQPTNVIERIILFMSRTGNSVYWVGTIGLYAWQFLSKTAGTAVSFVDSYALSPLDRATIESLIINRHRRSGMPLRFTEPGDRSALMRRRLRPARTPEQRQALLREDYFDRLWRSSGENIMLALYYWIRSAHFDADGGTLSVQPPRPLYFDFLTSFDLNQAFTLKAFFLHKTLSVEDHRRIFRTSMEASTAILESLLKACLIEPVPEAERVQQHDDVERDAIYRLQPMVIHPVTAYLRGKNIVH